MLWKQANNEGEEKIGRFPRLEVFGVDALLAEALAPAEAREREAAE